MAEKSAQSVGFDVEFIGLSAEEIPLERDCVDTVLVTYTLCTIPDLESALREMARVLRPGGELIFCEHGVAPDANIRRWQNCINPVWKRIGGGCNLNRDIPELIEQNKSGLIIPPGDAQAIAGAIMQLYKNTDFCKEMGKNARVRIGSSFRIEDTIAKTHALYQRLMAS